MKNKDANYAKWIEHLRCEFTRKLNEMSGKEWKVTTAIWHWDFHFVCKLDDFVRQTHDYWFGSLDYKTAKDLNAEEISEWWDHKLDLEVRLIYHSWERHNNEE